MKKLTLFIALFVCAIGFSQQNTSLSEWAEENPDYTRAQTQSQETAIQYNFPGINTVSDLLNSNHSVESREATRPALITTISTFGGTQTFTTLVDFEAACSGTLLAEDFSGGPGGIAACGTGPMSSAGNGCYPAGELIDDFEIEAFGAGGLETVYVEAGSFPNASDLVGPNSFADTMHLTFTGADAVNSLSFEIFNFQVDDTDIRIYDDGGTLMDTFNLNTPAQTDTFFGVMTDYTIGHIELEGVGGTGELVSNLQFGDCGGGSGGGCVTGVYTDRVSFDAEAGALPIEDFAGGPGTGISGCGEILSSAGDDTCYPAGEILEGVEITTNTPANGTLYVHPDGGFGNTIEVVGTNTFTDFTIMSFPAGDVNAFGFELYSLFEGTLIDIRIFGAGGLISTENVTTTNGAGVFFGYIADEAILSVEIEDLTGVNVEVFGMLAFGECSGGSGDDCAASEDFDAGLPAGWSTVINTGTCDWFNGPDMPTGPDFDTPAMYFDDDACGNGADASNVTLMSDVYDASGATSGTLDYDVAFQEVASGDTFVVEVFDGAAWQQVALYDTDLPEILSESIDVTAFTNAAFQVRFTYDDGLGAWGWHAGVDNFCLSHDGGPGDAPENDLCEGAIAIECGTSETGDTTDATNTDNPGTCDTDLSTGPGVWYTITIPGDADYEVDVNTFGSGYDTKLGVFSGDCGALVCVAGNDDADGTLQSQVIFEGALDATYYVYVTGFQLLAGAYTLNVECTPIVGTNDNTIEGFSYYPNPSSSVINLSAQDNIERVAIYNILGQKVVDQNINATTSQINVANLVTGTYLMEVSVDGKSATYKIVKN